MALSIKEERVDRKVRQLASLAGTSLTGAVELAVDRELERRAERDEDDLETFLADIREIQARVAALPVLSTLSADELLGYDENGLPT